MSLGQKFPGLKTEHLGKTKCGTGTASVRIVTYHGTQGSTAKGALTPLLSTSASAHEVHDSKEGYKLANDNEILCHVGGANSGNYGIEDATFANWTRKLWFLHKRTLRWSAHQIAHGLLRNDRKCNFITIEEAERAGGVSKLNGWTYHGVLSRTSWCPSTHYDPAANAGIAASTFPHKWFRRLVNFYYDHPQISCEVAVDKHGRETARSKRKRRK